MNKTDHISVDNLAKLEQKVSSAFYYCGNITPDYQCGDLARGALKKLLCQQNLIQEKGPLTFSDFTEVLEVPHYWVTLSHTRPRLKEMALNFASAGLANKKKWGGIGVDVEWALRPMLDGAKKYFVNQLDQNFKSFGSWNKITPPPLLLLWSKKEAAFKALRQTQRQFREQTNRELLLKDIWINGDFFGLCQSPQIAKGTVSSVEAFFYQSFIMSVAHLYLDE